MAPTQKVRLVLERLDPETGELTRVLVPAEGYYEWMKTADGKVPTYLRPKDGGLLAFAGLYEFWPDPSLPDDHPNKWLATCTIITTSAQDSLGHIHDRTPVIVPEDLQADWLDPKTTAKADVAGLLDAMPEPELVPVTVSDRANSVRNNGPELIEPADDIPLPLPCWNRARGPRCPVDTRSCRFGHNQRVHG